MPSTPYDAKGLLVSAIRDADPVVFLEPTKLYRSVKQEIPEELYDVPIGKANVVQEGNDVTLVSWGGMVRVCNEAIEKLGEKYSVELIDLRTIYPLDVDAVIGSVKKTGRCVVVHEAARTCGFGAEISALVSESDLLSLKAPVERVTGFDVVMPLAKYENFYLPNEKRVSRAIEKVMGF